MSTIELGAGISTVWLRGLIALSGAAIMMVLATNGLGGPALVLVGIAVLMSVGVPASPAPALVLLLVAISAVAIGGSPFAPHVLLLVPLVHLLHVSCALAGLVPMRSRIQRSALRAPAIRFLAIQAGTFALAGVIALAPTGRAPAVLEMVAVGGIAVIAVILWRLMHRAL